MPTGTSRPLLSPTLVFFLTTAAAAQSPILFTSKDAHVTLPRGMSVTLQTEAPPGALTPSLSQVPAGQLMHTTLHRPLKGSSARPGDPVEFTLDYAIRIHGDGGVVSVPAGAKIVGHVAEVAQRDDRSSKSRLGVIFERLMSGGRQWALCVKVVAMQGAKPFPNDPAQSKQYVQPPRPEQDAHSVLAHVGQRTPNR